MYSHPGKLLNDHLEQVANSCVIKFNRTKHNLSDFFPTKIWEKLVWLIGFSHDIGKATKYFQNYLFESNKEKKIVLKNQPETSHSLLSAVIAFWILEQFVKGKNNSLFSLMPFYIFLIIKRHHGNIRNVIPSREANNELDSNTDFLDKQFTGIDKDPLAIFFHRINDKLDLELEVNKFPKQIKDYYKTEIRRKTKNLFKYSEKKIDYYLIFQFLYSILLHSDKYDAIFGSECAEKRALLNRNIVEDFKNKKFGEPETKIDRVRENIFNDANKTADNVNLRHKLYSLNVPTGSGKTLTALSVALRLRERLEKEEGFTPRIIYSLPFTSIIDQNYDVFYEVFNSPNSELLLKHHHLSELFYKSDRDEEFDTNQSQFLIESWESEIIVTTFIQLFHTLLTNRNRALKKFHKLANSIILLDEVQTIPIKYWHLVRDVLRTMSEVFNTYVIMMTATQPRIFSKKEIVELVPEKVKYFGKLNRVHLSFEKNDYALKNFNELVLKNIISSEESFLIVLNTIKSSSQLFNFLIENGINEYIFYLSTNIIPKHRSHKIRKIKESKERKIIISTQMVEAGVDIDVENVWRDFGPLDSINQVCGRCNRNFRDRLGNVRIFQLRNEENNYLYKYIYGDSPLSLIETINSFRGKTSFNEHEFLKNIDNYYQRIEENMSSSISEKIIGDVKKLKFDEISKFRLIENDDYYKKDVFIEYDETAKVIWRKFIDIRELPIFERNVEFTKIKRELYEYVISIPVKYVVDDEFEDSGIVYIPNDRVELCYDTESGWKRENGSSGSLIL